MWEKTQCFMMETSRVGKSQCFMMETSHVEQHRQGIRKHAVFSLKQNVSSVKPSRSSVQVCFFTQHKLTHRKKKKSLGKATLIETMKTIWQTMAVDKVYSLSSCLPQKLVRLTSAAVED